jgi:hypothetical protein
LHKLLVKRRRLRTECLKALTVGGAAAIAADTSSSAAASIPVVWVAAATFAAVSAEPVAAKSVAAEVISSGAAITYDMAVHLLASPWLSLARRSSGGQNSAKF